MYKFLFFTLLLVLTSACGSGSSESETTSTSEPTENNISEEPTTSSTTPDPDQDPCELLNTEKLAEILGLVADNIVLEKDQRGMYCTAKSSNLDEGNPENAIQFLYVDKFIPRNGRPNVESMMTRQIESNAFRIPAGPDKGKDVPTKKITGIGDLAFIYSASNFSTLVYHFNNEIRYTLTLYRALPEQKLPIGLDQTTDYLEGKLVEIAKTMHP